MAKWIKDPQNREEVEKVTEELKLPVWKAWYKGKFRDFWNECWAKIENGYLILKDEKINKSGDDQVGVLQFKERCTDVNAPGQIGLGGLTCTGYVHINANTNGTNADSPVTITSGQGITGIADKGLAVGKDYLKWLGGAVWHAGNFNPRSYEPKINKKTGFNLNKSDSVSTNNSDLLATSKAVYDLGQSKLNKTILNNETGLMNGTSGIFPGHGNEMNFATGGNSVVFGYRKLNNYIDKYYFCSARGSSGVENLADITCKNINIQNKSDSLDLDSTSTLATSRAVKTLNDNSWRLKFKPLANGTDLNTITEVGNYTNPTNVNTIVNAPVSGIAFMLTVESIQANNSAYSRQTLKEYNSYTTYVRLKNTYWSPWKRIDGGDREPAFAKRTGFNLNKSDSISYDSSNALATSKAVKTVYDYAKTKVETLYDIKITGHMLDSTSGYYGFTYGNGGIGISGSNSIGFKSTSTTYCLNYDQIEGSAKIDKFAFFAASGSGTYATIQAGDIYSNGVRIPTAMTKVWSGSIRATNTKICNMPANWKFAIVVYNWSGGQSYRDAQITVPNSDLTNLGDANNEYFVTVKDGQIYTGSWNGQGEDGIVKAIYAMV